MRYFISILLLIVAAAAKGQKLHVDSTRFINGNKCCLDIRYAIPTTDNSILFTGIQIGNTGGIVPYFATDTVLNNVLVGKIDDHQKISWVKVFGGSQDDGATAICETSDGGYAVLGTTNSVNGDVTSTKGNADMWLLRLDGNGNLLWQQVYGSTGGDGGMSVAATPDGGFVMLGSSDGSGADIPYHYGSNLDADWIVEKTDGYGNIQWVRNIGGTDYENIYGTVLAIDTNYYIISASASRDHDCTASAWHAGNETYTDCYVFCLGAHGQTLWDSSYGGGNAEIAGHAIYDERDNSIVFTGWTLSNDYMVSGYQGGQDIWVVKIRTDGTLLWQKTLGTSDKEDGTGICKGPDGGYIVYGNVRYSATGLYDLWWYLLDGNGNQISDEKFGGGPQLPQVSYSILPYLGGYAAVGRSAATAFTEGTSYGCMSPTFGGSFVSYLDTATLSVLPLPMPSCGELRAYPVPAADHIQIEVPQAGGALQVTDVTGRSLYKAQVTNKTTMLTVAEWPQGMYMVQYRMQSGATVSERFVVDKQ